MVVPIFKMGTRIECSNHRGVSLTLVGTKLLSSLILRRLMAAREVLTRKNQAGFRPGRKCVDYIFTLRQVLEQRHMYRRPTILVFLDFKGALSPFLFNFVIDEIMRRTLDGFQNPGVQIVAGESFFDLEYADDIALIFEDHSKAQALLNELTVIIPSFGMRLATSKCKVLLQNVPSTNISLTIQAESLEIVENFTYLGSCISSDGSVSDEVSASVSKARITFANLCHLWRQKVRAVLLYGCEAWPLRTDDVRRLRVFDHRCLRGVAGLGWRQRVSNAAIRKRAPQSGKASSIIDYDGSVMCYACRNTVYRDECFSPCLLQDDANREVDSTWLGRRASKRSRRVWMLLVLCDFKDGVPVTPSVLGWRRCKKWRLIDVSGVRATTMDHFMGFKANIDPSLIETSEQPSEGKSSSVRRLFQSTKWCCV
ncbi:hypothetical protein T265_05160 [Opisthorchis viverrini]|uniref:Reverse transcriptase domain-containing protein n=1 Tax=Opisthorchis viverrini TaxID=6198 RepID=A0A074ZPY4_OPIVI|nr:hypothetical protein T265_05160 [Opisthorchis viverrini]KER27877.1 hypothetical protein T265_05160 [Opisthorchis viverrini]